MYWTNKTKRFALCCLAALSIIFASCEKDKPKFDESLLPGKWVSGTEYYRYDATGPGATWDTSDDVTEEEAQPFEWTMDGDQLTLIHIMEMGGRVPKVYTVTALSNTTLSYRDNYSQSFTYNRVN